LKLEQKEVYKQRKKQLTNALSGPVNANLDEIYFIDTSSLDFYKRLKESVE
jgi:hypothetical protein